jgi:hypothetical protein
VIEIFDKKPKGQANNKNQDKEPSLAEMFALKKKQA